MPRLPRKAASASARSASLASFAFTGLVTSGVVGLVLGSAMVLGFVASCGQSPESSAREARSQGARPREAAKVLVAPVERADMIEWLEATTVVESEREIQVFPRNTGNAVEVLVEEGDAVEAEAVLARLDRREQALAVRDAEVALEESRTAKQRAELAVPEAREKQKSARRAAEQAETDYQRDLKLASQGDLPSSVSKKALDASLLARDNALHQVEQEELALRRAEFEAQSSKTAIARAELALEKARIALSYTEVRAPFAGLIAKRSIRVGDAISPAAAVFTLTDPVALRAVFYRPQRELALFARPSQGEGRERLPVWATTEALPGRQFRGEVLRTSPTVDASSGAFRVTARLERESEGAQLLAGMLVRLRIAVGKHPQALVVPKRSFSREGGAGHVYAVRDNTARRVEVTEGYSDDQRVEVLPVAGAVLTSDDVVILVGSRDIEDGTPVRPEREGALQPTPAANPAAPAADSGAPAATAAGGAASTASDAPAAAKSSEGG
jgi:membrane fusion protein (multidrug efflux system)